MRVYVVVGIDDKFSFQDVAEVFATEPAAQSFTADQLARPRTERDYDRYRLVPRTLHTGWRS